MKIRLQVDPSKSPAFVSEHTGPRITIGREPGCELILQGPGCDTVSRQHIAIEQTDFGILVTDLGSANGTLLNDKPLENAEPLVVGDRIQLGHTGPVLQVLDLDATVGAVAEPSPPRQPVKPAVNGAPAAAAAAPAAATEAAKPKRFPVVAVGLGVGVGVCVLVTLAILAMWKLFGVQPQTSASVASHTTSTSKPDKTAVRPTERSTPATEKSTGATGPTTKTAAATNKEPDPKKND